MTNQLVHGSTAKTIPSIVETTNTIDVHSWIFSSGKDPFDCLEKLRPYQFGPLLYEFGHKIRPEEPDGVTMLGTDGTPEVSRCLPPSRSAAERGRQIVSRGS